MRLAVYEPLRLLACTSRLKTLHLRAHTALKSVASLALALEASRHILTVHYPGLSSHPQRYVTIKQHREGLGGGIISFRI